MHWVTLVFCNEAQARKVQMDQAYAPKVDLCRLLARALDLNSVAIGGPFF